MQEVTFHSFWQLLLTVMLLKTFRTFEPYVLWSVLMSGNCVIVHKALICITACKHFLTYPGNFSLPPLPASNTARGIGTFRNIWGCSFESSYKMHLKIQEIKWLPRDFLCYRPSFLLIVLHPSWLSCFEMFAETAAVTMNVLGHSKYHHWLQLNLENLMRFQCCR